MTGTFRITIAHLDEEYQLTGLCESGHPVYLTAAICDGRSLTTEEFQCLPSTTKNYLLKELGVKLGRTLDKVVVPQEH